MVTRAAEQRSRCAKSRSGPSSSPAWARSLISSSSSWDRLAGRILGMGDIVGLVEKAAEAIDEEEAARMEKKLLSAKFDLNDFLAQFKMIRKLGPLENILGMLPGVANLKGFPVDEKQLKR